MINEASVSGSEILETFIIVFYTFSLVLSHYSVYNWNNECNKISCWTPGELCMKSATISTWMCIWRLGQKQKIKKQLITTLLGMYALKILSRITSRSGSALEKQNHSLTLLYLSSDSENEPAQRLRCDIWRDARQFCGQSVIGAEIPPSQVRIFKFQ